MAEREDERFEHVGNPGLVARIAVDPIGETSVSERGCRGPRRPRGILDVSCYSPMVPIGTILPLSTL